MKNTFCRLFVATALFTWLHNASAQVTTAITYQGELNFNGNPATGLYDFSFAVFSAAGGGTQQGSTVTTNAVVVNNGYFAIALDFGNIYGGSPLWLAISVKTNGAGSYSTLAPRQQLTPTPYALYAPSAGTAATANVVGAGAVGSAGLQTGAVIAGKVAAGAIAATNLDAQTFGTTFWKADGNAGTIPGTHFLGTTDNKSLELRANNVAALKLTPSQWGSSVAAGGGGTTASGSTAVSMGYGTTASGAAAVALGDRTTASGWESTALGEVTSATGDYATAMGNYTKATNFCATAMGTNTLAGGIASLAMGRNTKATASSSVAMGLWSTASGANSLAGGYSCTAAGSSSVALGYYAYADHGDSFVWNDGSTGASGDIHTTGENQFVIGASGGVGIGAAPGDAMLDIQGNVRLNKHDLYFREGTDKNHGVGWYGTGRLFGTDSPDGPVLYGWSGGALGTTSSGAQLTLQWSANGNVTVRGTLAQGSDRNAKTNFSPWSRAWYMTKWPRCRCRPGATKLKPTAHAISGRCRRISTPHSV